MGHKYDPDYAVHPGETVKECLEQHKISSLMAAWRSISDLSKVDEAEALGEEIAMIAACRKNIEIKHAVALRFAFRLPVKFWMNLQANYDERLVGLPKRNLSTKPNPE